jgi:hypothetical protein
MSKRLNGAGGYVDNPVSIREGSFSPHCALAHIRNYVRLRVSAKVIIVPQVDHLTEHPIGRNPDTLVHTLRALDSRSGVPIGHVSRKLGSSPNFEYIGARID